MIKPLNSFDLKNKRVLLRVDFNVPTDGDRVLDDFRIKQTLFITNRFTLGHSRGGRTQNV